MSRDEESFGSPFNTTSSWAIRPSRERMPVGVTLSTPDTAASRRRAAATSAGVAAPFSRSTSAVIGESSPAGNDFCITRKPSTLSVCFLKNVVVL